MVARSNITPLIVIVGETGGGKSELAIELAEKFKGEIICADSWTVYRDFDIGTAKPTAADRAQMPHHLLDVADPRIGFSAAEYKRLAEKVIKDITSRDKVPFLVGGTGLYIDSVIFNYGFLPPPSLELRTKLNAIGLPELLAKAEKLELPLDTIDLQNKRRVIRLIENNGQQPTKQGLRSDTLVLGLKVPPEVLRVKITQRVDKMFNAGLEQEVLQLAERYGWEVEPMKGIGYREFHDYFDGKQNLEKTRERIISATLNLAKRQRTWLKRNNSIQWIEEQGKVVDLVTTFLNK